MHRRRENEARLDRPATRHTREQSGATMYSTRGHPQIVNEYHDECLRQARERETERDAHIRRLHGGDAAAPRAPEGTSPPPQAEVKESSTRLPQAAGTPLAG